MTRPVASVIVPAYNAAPYIERCLGSLAQQEIPLQIVVVNDGSTDGTAMRVGSIEVPSRHTMALVEQPNAGLSAARNTGLRHAHGAFIGFVDADDWVESDMYVTLVDAACEHRAQIVIGTGHMVDHSSGRMKPFHDHRRFSELAANQDGPFAPGNVSDVFALDTSVCRRLYSRAFLEEQRFEFADGLLFEDVLAHFQLLLAAQRVYIIDRSFYRYRINHPGRITDRRDEQVLTIFEVLRRSRNALFERNASLAVWTTFVWFQSWVLRWLGSQVAVINRPEFGRRMHSFVRTLPMDAIEHFRLQFVHDRDAQEMVAVEQAGAEELLWRLILQELTAVDRHWIDGVLRARTGDASGKRRLTS
jgi:glycosyltransferase involved in cell wall biosynthesis